MDLKTTGLWIGGDRVTAHAWCRLNGTGTPATTVDYNISSVTDNGAGNYTLGFSVSFDSSLYACAQSVAPGYIGGCESFFASSCIFKGGDSNWSGADVNPMDLMIIGD
jgi:hypothetical protein